MKTDFSGLWTALITPFKEGNGINNEVDFEALDRLLQLQIEGGVDGVLLLGTTGETPTLTKEEQINIVKFAIPKLIGKTKIMVNVGTNSTIKSLENIKNFEEIDGIDVYLIVNPYYNKPTQNGLYLHFTTLANFTKKPIVLYNIKGRTGVNLETETLLKILKTSSNVIGVKEASGDLLQMENVLEKTAGSDFIVLSGDDSLTYDLINRGGNGVISVASNLIPKQMKEFVELCFIGDKKASELNNKYSEFFTKIFLQTNPLPTKTYLAYKGLIKETFRLPMCPMDNEKKQEFLEFISKNGF